MQAKLALRKHNALAQAAVDAAGLAQMKTGAARCQLAATGAVAHAPCQGRAFEMAQQLGVAAATARSAQAAAHTNAAAIAPGQADAAPSERLLSQPVAVATGRLQRPQRLTSHIFQAIRVQDDAQPQKVQPHSDAQAAEAPLSARPPPLAVSDPPVTPTQATALLTHTAPAESNGATGPTAPTSKSVSVSTDSLGH